MPARCSIFVPVPFFPNRSQLEPLCGDGFVEVSEYDERAQVKWKGVSMTLARVTPSEVPDRLQGLIAHANQNGGSPALETRILHALAVYDVEITPDFDEAGRAMGVVSGVTDAADGLCFFDGEIFAAGGRALLSKEEALAPPPAERVRDRAHVLLALSMRGLLEQDAGTKDETKAEAMRAQLQDWVEGRLDQELEPEESEFLSTPIGQADPGLVVDAVWRAEGAQVLLWALNARPLPRHDQQEHPYDVAKAAGVMGEVPRVLAAPKLRSLAELEAKRKTLLGVHWRVRELEARPGPVDFVKFSKSAWFGAFSLEGVHLAGADVAFGEQPVTRVKKDEFSLVRSIAHERHLAANWLIGVHESYTRVNTPT